MNQRHALTQLDIRTERIELRGVLEHLDVDVEVRGSRRGEPLLLSENSNASLTHLQFHIRSNLGRVQPIALHLVSDVFYRDKQTRQSGECLARVLVVPLADQRRDHGSGQKRESGEYGLHRSGPAFLSHVARSRSGASSDTAPRIAWRCVRISVAENP